MRNIQDYKTLMEISKYFLIVACICTTSFPFLYLFSPWYRSQLGRLLMLQSVTLASALNLSLLFRYWRPKNIVVLFWINLVILGLIALSSALLTLMLWKANHSRWFKNRETNEKWRNKRKESK